MQLQNDRWRYGNEIVLLVNKRQRISVSSDFFLCAGAWLGGIRMIALSLFWVVTIPSSPLEDWVLWILASSIRTIEARV